MKPLSDYISLNEVEMDIGPNYFKSVVPVVELKKAVKELKDKMIDKMWDNKDYIEVIKLIDGIFGEKLTNDS